MSGSGETTCKDHSNINETSETSKTSDSETNIDTETLTDDEVEEESNKSKITEIPRKIRTKVTKQAEEKKIRSEWLNIDVTCFLVFDEK